VKRSKQTKEGVKSTGEAPQTETPEAEAASPQPDRTGTQPSDETEAGPAPVEAAAPEGAAERAPAPAEAAPTTLEEALARWGEARSLADEYLDGWQRARAEFANYKKRVDRELEQARGTVAAEVLTHILPILDDLERALRDRPEAENLQAWAEGIELIHRKLATLLEAEGVEQIQAVGETFDPNVHEAITFEENDEVEHGKIIDVIRQGYRLGERVLRPAMVRVAR